MSPAASVVVRDLERVDGEVGDAEQRAAREALLERCRRGAR